MNPEKKKLIDHVSRLEGQLSAVKAELGKADPDCMKVSETLMSASRSFAGLREQCMKQFLLKYFVDTKKSKDEKMFDRLLTLSKG